MLTLNHYEEKLVEILSGDLGDSPTPFADIAQQLGVSEDEVLQSIVSFQAAGFLRRLGATLRHQKSGFQANAMMVFQVNEENIDQAGASLAELPYVSHCYQRESCLSWPYNLYAMVHALNREDLLSKARDMSERIKARQWKMLESLRELKKTSLKLTFSKD